MPPKLAKKDLSIARLRGKLRRHQQSITEILDEVTDELGQPWGVDAAEIQPRLKKVSTSVECVEDHTIEYDNDSQRLAEVLDPETEGSEKEIDEALDFLFQTRASLRKFRSTMASMSDIPTEELTSGHSHHSGEAGHPGDAPPHSHDLSAALTQLITIQQQTQHQLQTTQTLLHDQLHNHLAPPSRHATDPSVVALPKLKLTKFSGDILKWSEFFEMFVSCVHSQKNLSDVQKFAYLRDSLSGHALECIAGLTLSNSNYAVALGLLKERFGLKQAQVNAIHQAIMALPAANNSAASLRKLYDTIEMHVRSLEALSVDTCQEIFVPLISCKIPKRTMAQLELQKCTGPHDEWTSAHLRECLLRYVRAQESADRLGSSSGAGESTKPGFAPGNSDDTDHHASSAQALAAPSSSTRQPTKKITCAFCRGAHYSDECMRYTTVADRKKAAGNRCFRCLRKDHTARECTTTKCCFYCKALTHHSSMCPSRFAPPARSSPPDLATTTLVGEDQAVVMQTAQVKIVIGSEDKPTYVPARILFDTGSSRSFVTQSLQTRASLTPVDYDLISLATFGNTTRKTQQYPRVEFQIVKLDGRRQKLSANVIPQITSPIQRVPLDPNKHPSLRSLPLAEPLEESMSDRLRIDILIGLDQYYDIISTDRLSITDQFHLLHSTVGFIGAGKVQSSRPTSSEDNACLVFDSCPIQEPELDLERFWSVEDAGVTNDHDDDSLAYDSFKKTTTYADNRYTVRWPWRENHPPLADNKSQALGRLQSLIRRLDKDPHLKARYDEVLDTQNANGVIEEVPASAEHTHPTMYLPHHCVLRPDNNTTKLRVVYDASAKPSRNAPSLNDCLYQGPTMLPDLCGILLRFRLHPIAICSDIEKAFLQLNLNEQDRDVTRFLWVKDLQKPANSANIKTFRFRRVPFGVISSPFLLSATLQRHLTKAGTEDAAKILRNTYVDNVLTGTDTPREAIRHYATAKDLLASASMNLRQWSSNSSEVLAALPPHDVAKGSEHKCLGILWNTTSDTIYNSLFQAQPASTKREVLRRLSSFFDPLGLKSPVTIRAKILMQEIWKLNVAWDEALPPPIQMRWKKIADDLAVASVIESPRFIRLPQSEGSPVATHTLQVFCDASNDAYAAVAYLSTTTGDKTSTQLLFCKTRVAPVKTVTIPRLELMAAVLGTKVIQFIRKELDLCLKTTTLWSDSTTVLQWLASSSGKLPTPGVDFSYIPTKLNPADLPSRGTSAATLHTSTLWWHGPDPLPKPTAPITVPVNLSAGEGPTEYNTKGSKGGNPKENTLSEKIVCPLGIDIHKLKFHSFEFLLRVSALCLSFLSRINAKSAPRSTTTSTTTTSTTTTAALKKAERLWLQYLQRSSYPDILDALNARSRHPLINKLNLFMEDGLIRCRGRLENAELCYDSRFPILLPKKHPLTVAIILDCHKKVLHGGAAHTLSCVRSKFWIPSGRATVKNSIRGCRTCIRWEGGPYRTPKMSPLPASRVSITPPFRNVGIDYFGPVLIRTTAEPSKAWVCLYACMVTRAVHLELVINMTAAEFLLSLRRFIARRGMPSTVVSDNAPQFKLVQATLDTAWQEVTKSTTVQSYAASNKINWHYIVQYSPWMGGMYERLVQTVKRALRKSLGRQLFTPSQMITLLSEIEAVVNSRPLTYVDDELSTILTPAHFLTLSDRSSGGFVLTSEEDDPTFNPTESSADNLLKIWRKGQNRLDQLWSIWKSDYLTQLREAHRTEHKQHRKLSAANPAIGDVVLVKDNLPRGSWRLARIVELQNSRDNEVRSATIVTASKDRLKRPLCLLYPLECSHQNTDINAPTHQAPATVEQAPVNQQTSQRPQRSAAAKQRRDLQDLIQKDVV